MSVAMHSDSDLDAYTTLGLSMTSAGPVQDGSGLLGLNLMMSPFDQSLLGMDTSPQQHLTLLGSSLASQQEQQYLQLQQQQQQLHLQQLHLQRQQQRLHLREQQLQALEQQRSYPSSAKLRHSSPPGLSLPSPDFDSPTLSVPQPEQQQALAAIHRVVPDNHIPLPQLQMHHSHSPSPSALTSHLSQSSPTMVGGPYVGNASALARMQRASSVKRKRPHADAHQAAFAAAAAAASGREGAQEEEVEDLKPIIAEGKVVDRASSGHLPSLGAARLAGAGAAVVPTVSAKDNSAKAAVKVKEERRRKRLLRNRVSAQLARERKRNYIQEVEHRCTVLEQACGQLEEQINNLCGENDKLRQMMKRKVKHATAGGEDEG